jgi:hypothetical protein
VEICNGLCFGWIDEEEEEDDDEEDDDAISYQKRKLKNGWRIDLKMMIIDR